MKIKAQVNLVKNQTGDLKAMANITIDGCFVVNDLCVKSGQNGLWVSMPSKKMAKEYNGKVPEVLNVSLISSIPIILTLETVFPSWIVAVEKAFFLIGTCILLKAVRRIVTLEVPSIDTPFSEHCSTLQSSINTIELTNWTALLA